MIWRPSSVESKIELYFPLVHLRHLKIVPDYQTHYCPVDVPSVSVRPTRINPSPTLWSWYTAGGVTDWLIVMLVQYAMVWSITQLGLRPIVEYELRFEIVFSLKCARAVKTNQCFNRLWMEKHSKKFTVN